MTDLTMVRGMARMVLDRRGHIVELAHEPSGRTITSIPRLPGHDSLRCTVRDRDDAHGGTTYTLRDAKVTLEPLGDAGAELRVMLGGGAVEVLCRILPGPNHGWEWRTVVTNHHAPMVWSLTLPCLERVGRPARDQGGHAVPGGHLTVPFNSGWIVPLRALHNQDELTLNYPVHLAMQWVDIHDDDLGLYFAVHDPVPWLKQLQVRAQATGVSVGWRFIDLGLRPGMSAELPPVVLALHEGDWHEGANLYRSWIAPHLAPAQPPAWLAEQPAWTWIGMKDQHADAPKRAYASLPETMKGIRQCGIRLGHVAGWMEHGHDTHFPDYWPGECMGGPQGLREAIEIAYEQDGRLALYANGRLIDPEGSVGQMPDWQSMAVVSAPCSWDEVYQRAGNAPWATHWDPQQRLAKERYTNVVFAVGCPGSARWRDLLAERLANCVIQSDAHGLYVDQVCGCSALPCYADNHDHEYPALAWSGYKALLADVRERVRAHNPNAYLATEGLGDLLGQYFDIQQAHNDWAPRMLTERGLPLPELFRWTLPRMLVAIGPAPADQQHFLHLGHAMAAGFDTFLMDPKRCDAQTLDTAKRVLDWRRQLAREIVNGQPIRVDSDAWPDCRVLALQGAGSTIITGAWFANPPRALPTPRDVTLHFHLAPGDSVQRVMIDTGAGWKQADWSTQLGGRVTCRVQSAPCFTVRVETLPRAAGRER